MKWMGIIAVLTLIAACFIPWVYIESKLITVTGVSAEGTNFGKPGYLHFIFSFLFILCTFIPRIGAKRVNLIVTGLNLAWAIRNYFVITACAGGDCPEKQAGLWLALIASVVMLLSALFPDIELPAERKE